MADYDYDIGVIGGGAAGLTVTAGAAQLGAKTLLVEKEDKLGGDCLHCGCVPSKTLIKTAKVYHQMKNAEKYGLPRAAVQAIDFSNVRQRIMSVIAAIQPHDSPERFCSLGARVEFGNGTFIDDHTLLLNGTPRSAKTWVIATGSSPAIPPIPGLDATPYITNKDVFYLDSLPESLIVLGAGPIATEMAQAFGRLGSRVSVVQRSNQILSREDQDMADEIMNVLGAEGVTFHLNAQVKGVKNIGNEREVILTQGNGTTTSLKAEKLLVAMGRSPNLDGLELKNTGIQFDRKGITVDQRLRTSRRHIFAAGDVTGAYQFTHAAGYEGGIVISNAVFHLPRKTDYTFFPWCTYTDPELASIGLNEKRAKAAGIKYSVWTEAFKDNDRSRAEGEHVGKIKMLLNEKEKPIGVQICGPHAGDLINEWVAALNGNIKLSTLASSVHPYPTLGEINKRVAGNYLTPKIFSEKVKKGLKFFFHLKGRARCD